MTRPRQALPSTARRIAAVAVATTAGIACSLTPAAAMDEQRVTVSNFTTIGPEQTGPVSVKCPKKHPYLVGLTATGTGQGTGPFDPIHRTQGQETKVKVDAVTLANSPESSRITFTNSSKYKDQEKPEVRVKMEITLECSNVDPGKLPETINVSTIGYTVDYESPTGGLIKTWLITQCPTGTHTAGGHTQYDHDKVSTNDYEHVVTAREWKAPYWGDGTKKYEIIQTVWCTKD
ncbi:hypothetical protein GCM10010517_39510 [Streptosporangium fragile]|uniref:Uncharacterized protein n=1 Tax=Streptosporangium fragile TaxID=46186 RepID=A0ABP6IIR0_9ACTN